MMRRSRILCSSTSTLQSSSCFHRSDRLDTVAICSALPLSTAMTIRLPPSARAAQAAGSARVRDATSFRISLCGRHFAPRPGSPSRLLTPSAAPPQLCAAASAAPLCRSPLPRCSRRLQYSFASAMHSIECKNQGIACRPPRLDCALCRQTGARGLHCMRLLFSSRWLRIRGRPRRNTPGSRSASGPHRSIVCRPLQPCPLAFLAPSAA